METDGPGRHAGDGNDRFQPTLGDRDGGRQLQPGRAVADQRGRAGHANLERTGGAGFWDGAARIICHDGKARRAESRIPLLVDGFPGRVAAWRGFGNAIVAPLAAEVIKALMETLP